MTKKPDRLNIDKKDREIYDNIKWFSKKENKEKFLFAMAYGFINNIKHPLKSKEGYILDKYLRPEDEALIYSLVVKHTGSADVLLDLNKVYEIAEEYAHAGLKLLYDESTTKHEHGTFSIRLEKELHKIVKEQKIDKLSNGDN